MKKILLFSDGSSLGNPGPGGWGTILQYKEAKKELSGGNPHTTNNIMELTGVIEGLKVLKEKCDITIFSDSKYVVQGINEWLANWKKNNWRTASKTPVKNQELWEEYDKISALHTIEAIWVKGHAGHIENERCDLLARNEAQKFALIEKNKGIE